MAIRCFKSIVLLLSMIALSACSHFTGPGSYYYKRDNIYLQSVATQKLVIPAGLSSANFEDYYELPKYPPASSVLVSLEPPSSDYHAIRSHRRFGIF